jgi:hypothetical protein
MTFSDAILAAQALASSAMAGLIWFVQVVHYPLFQQVTGEAARDYSQAHRRRTPWVVIPPMLVEAATAALVALRPPAGIPPLAAWCGLGLVLALWWSTGAVQMPLHARLGQEGHRLPTVNALVRSNWLRTVLWTARALLAVWMLQAAA